jgi:hypothetical protein
MKNITLKLCITFCALVSFATHGQFSESFEALTIPAGWSVINQGDANTWQAIDLSASTQISGHSGTHVMGIVYTTPTAHDDYLVTPAITVAAGVNDRFSFWARSRDPLYPEQIDLLLSTTTATVDEFTTTLQTNIAPPGGSSFYKYTYDLSSYVGQTVYIAFHSTTADLFIFDVDDVVSDALPFCSEPNPTVANITETGADFSWTAIPGSVNYEYVLDTNPADPAGAGTSTTALSYTASSLDANTTYYFHIRNNCDAAGFSMWTTVPALTLPLFNGCLDAPNFGVYPTATFTPTCDGVADDIVLDGYAAEYSNVNVVSGTEYTFASSNPSDYITISTDDGVTATAFSLTPLVWTATTTGVVRFYTHADATCGEEAVNRARSVNCGTFVPLTNDNLADALSVECGNIYTGSTAAATLDEDNAPDGFGADMDAPNVWYSYTGSGVPQTVTVNLCPSAYDTSVLVYTGTSGNLTLVAANDDDATCGVGFTTRSRVSFTSDGTSTYLIAIEGWNPVSSGAYSMEVTCAASNPPASANQTCALSLPVAVNAIDINSDNSFGDVSPVQPSCDLFGSIQDVWFSFVAPTSGTVACLLSPGTIASANFTIYGGDCFALTEVADTCNSDLIAPTTELLTGLTSGNTYYVQVWSNAAEQGTFSLRLTDPSLAANQFDASGFEAFPNPVNHILNLSYNSPITNVTIFNLLGQKVLMKSSTSNISQIDMSDLARGTYMVKIAADNQVNTIKIVKQ